MTALRVVSTHSELDEIGSLSHASIDSYLTGSGFIVASGSSTLPSARSLKAGSGITIIDEGPGGHLTISTTTSTSASGSMIAWNEVPSGLYDGVNASFNLSNVPTPSGSLMLFVNGVLQKQGPSSDYVTSGTLISLVDPPRQDSNVLATYPYSLSGGGLAWMESVAGVTNGINVTFTLSNIPVVGTLMLFVNGVLQKQGSDADYTIVGTTITMTYPPRQDSNILASYPY